VNTPACYKCHCKSSGLVYINGRHLCSVCLTAIVNAHATLKTRCQQAEKEREILREQCDRQGDRADKAEKTLRELGEMAKKLFADHFHNDDITWDECVEPACDFAEAVITVADALPKAAEQKTNV